MIVVGPSLGPDIDHDYDNDIDGQSRLLSQSSALPGVPVSEEFDLDNGYDNDIDLAAGSVSPLGSLPDTPHRAGTDRASMAAGNHGPVVEVYEKSRHANSAQVFYVTSQAWLRSDCFALLRNADWESQRDSVL